jgi:hypothetical protein
MSVIFQPCASLMRMNLNSFLIPASSFDIFIPVNQTTH